MVRRLAVAAATTLAVLAAAACGGGGGSGSGDALVVYSGRSEGLVKDLFAQFERASGVDVEVRYGDSAELAAQLLEEGGNRRADVFFSQDAGALGALAKEGVLAALPQATLDVVPAKFRAVDGTWVGVSGRARVIAYNSKRVTAAELPKSVFELTDPKWKGRVGIPPTNASFQAFVTAMRLTAGRDRTKKWLEDLRANDVKVYERNNLLLDAVDKGEVDLGLVNHYYLYEKIKEAGAANVVAKNHYVGGKDPGALVNVAGVGVVTGAKRAAEAQQFVDYLLSADGQKYFAERTAEYPMLSSVPPSAELPPLASISGPDIDLADLASLQDTLALLQEVGLT